MLVDLMFENQATHYIKRKKKKNSMSKMQKKKLDNKKIINFSQTDKEKRTKAINYQYHKSESGYDQIPQTQNIK